MSRVIQFQGQRAAESHLDNVQLNIDPIVTDLDRCHRGNRRAHVHWWSHVGPRLRGECGRVLFRVRGRLLLN